MRLRSGYDIEAKKTTLMSDNASSSSQNDGGVKHKRSVHIPKESSASDNLDGDRWNISVLIFFYVLQGIPLGLAAAIPFILTNLGTVTYKQQAEFSFAFWPFSLKLLWAPVVDSCYIAKFGRRKTWLVPVQYMIGLTMLLLSHNVDYYLNGEKISENIFILTCAFFFLNFLAATQDIAVDGWALTMLKPANIGWASTCNSIGQTAGFFIGYVFYLGLEAYGLITLSQFLFFWGVVFISVTTLVAIFKHETQCGHNKEEMESGHKDDEEKKRLTGEECDDLSLVETYVVLWKVVRLPLMMPLIFFLMTCRITFSASDSVTSLKLIERGVSKDILAMLSIPMMPLQMILPYFLTRQTSGPNPMSLWVKAFLPRMLLGIAVSLLVYITPYFEEHIPSSTQPHFSYLYYGLVLTVVATHQLFVCAMFVSIMAFFARISDPSVGGTYMTLLNTIANLGGNWPNTLALWFVDQVTVKKCSIQSVKALSLSINSTDTSSSLFSDALSCSTSKGQEACKNADNGNGTCDVTHEGYYIECAICLIFGLVWFFGWGKRIILRLQTANLTEWRTSVGSKGRVGGGCGENLATIDEIDVRDRVTL